MEYFNFTIRPTDQTVKKCDGFGPLFTEKLYTIAVKTASARICPLSARGVRIRDARNRTEITLDFKAPVVLAC